MTKKFFSVLILFLIFIQTIFVDHSFAITAEERLEEVEKQLIAIANQIKQYEGDKTDLEKAILANDSSLKKVNDELAEVQRRLVAAELALEKALEGYDESLDNLAAVQQNIVNEQVKLGTTKNEERIDAPIPIVPTASGKSNKEGSTLCPAKTIAA